MQEAARMRLAGRTNSRLPGFSVARLSSRLPAALISAALATCLLLPGCGGHSPRCENAAGTMADLTEIPQSLAAFAEIYGSPALGLAHSSGPLRGADTLLRSHSEARADMARFRRHFFLPWDMACASQEAVQDVRDELGRTGERRGFAENFHPWSEDAWQELADLADLPRLERALRGAAPRSAVTVRSTDLRALPTLKPRFSAMHGAGQGWPFDLFQYSRLPVGVPLAVVHESRDGAWLFVECSGLWGWIRTEDAAFAGADFRRLWRKARFAAFVRDGVSLRFRSLGVGQSKGAPAIAPGAFLAEAGIGTALPALRSGEVLLPMRGLDGQAYAVTASYAIPGLPGRGVSGFDAVSGAAVLMPQALTPRSVARIGDRMLGQSYGWGGLYGARDCSAMMRDLFTAFGIWLPRNSGKQAEAGMRVSLEGLSARAKEKALIEKAHPFRTLVWMPGHIGLYVGQKDGAALFHNMWGLRTKNGGSEGRAVIGRAVVTSLKPGEERGDIDEKGLLIERVRAFTVIGGEFSEYSED